MYLCMYMYVCMYIPACSMYVCTTKHVTVNFIIIQKLYRVGLETAFICSVARANIRFLLVAVCAYLHNSVCTHADADAIIMHSWELNTPARCLLERKHLC